MKESYLLNLKAELGTNSSASENFEQRNFKLETLDLQPRLSYLFNEQSRIEAFYGFGQKDNQLGEMEKLTQQDLGVAFSYANAAKLSLNGELKYINNDFSGSAFSPVAYQMLEGLQPEPTYLEPHRPAPTYPVSGSQHFLFWQEKRKHEDDTYGDGTVEGVFKGRRRVVLESQLLLLIKYDLI